MNISDTKVSFAKGGFMIEDQEVESFIKLLAECGEELFFEALLDFLKGILKPIDFKRLFEKKPTPPEYLQYLAGKVTAELGRAGRFEEKLDGPGMFLNSRFRFVRVPQTKKVIVKFKLEFGTSEVYSRLIECEHILTFRRGRLLVGLSSPEKKEGITEEVVKRGRGRPKGGKAKIKKISSVEIANCHFNCRELAKVLNQVFSLQGPQLFTGEVLAEILTRELKSPFWQVLGTSSEGSLIGFKNNSWTEKSEISVNGEIVLEFQDSFNCWFQLRRPENNDYIYKTRRPYQILQTDDFRVEIDIGDLIKSNPGLEENKEDEPDDGISWYGDEIIIPGASMAEEPSFCIVLHPFDQCDPEKLMVKMEALKEALLGSKIVKSVFPG